MRKLFLILFSLVLISTTISFTNKEIYSTVSWYGHPYHGRKTASGEVYNMYDLTAAHKSMKFGTKVKVTNLSNNKSVIVRINDRGPFVKNRAFDLSKKAFEQISKSTQQGVLKVKYQIVE